MELFVDRQIALDSSQAPSLEQMELWISKALEKAVFKQESIELTVRVVSKDESQQLNYQYRQKNKPTNVLSFPFDAPSEIDCDLLGDLVICESIVIEEAKKQSKSAAAHWAHMIVHGTLHLIGFDHVNSSEADIMEALEVSILKDLNIDNPYICRAL